MEYKIENCRYYEKLTINEKPIFIFDSHNMALPVWGTFASKIGFLHLLSFDTHTDTHPAFSKLMRDSGATPEWDYKESILNPIVSDVLKKISYQKETFCFEDVYKYSCDIGNTEQILTGVAFGYLSLELSTSVQSKNTQNSNSRRSSDTNRVGAAKSIDYRR